jgi:hypothetical protein
MTTPLPTASAMTTDLPLAYRPTCHATDAECTGATTVLVEVGDDLRPACHDHARNFPASAVVSLSDQLAAHVDPVLSALGASRSAVARVRVLAEEIRAGANCARGDGFTQRAQRAMRLVRDLDNALIGSEPCDDGTTTQCPVCDETTLRWVPSVDENAPLVYRLTCADCAHVARTLSADEAARVLNATLPRTGATTDTVVLDRCSRCSTILHPPTTHDPAEIVTTPWLCRACTDQIATDHRAHRLTRRAR